LKEKLAFPQVFQGDVAQVKQRHIFPYWMVWGPTRYPPKQRHETESDAVAEADRLATLKPGVRFYVFCMTATRKVEVQE
jgi:hypothetical protein